VDGAVQINIIAAGELGIEPGSEFEERRDAAHHADVAGGRSQNARHNPQHRTFAGAVSADNAEYFAAGDVEAQVIDGEKIPVPGAGIEAEEFREAAARRIVDGIALGNTLEFNGIHGKLQFSFLCWGD
jgi:hypothetical protein